jgi:predicted  nucleic acid-binding Zn-ribbon protein
VPPHSSLLEVQELDLACDGLVLRRKTLPEREALTQSHSRAASLDAAHTGLSERREGLNREEHTLSGEVAGVAAKAKEVEDTLYSGSVTAPKELETLQEEIRLLRERQSGLEEREMELLEEIDGTESLIADNRSERARTASETDDLGAAIGKAEGEIDAEVAKLTEQRGATSQQVPAATLAEYHRLRAKDRMAGRAAASLAQGSCGGCRMKLPVLEYNRMKAEPEDKLLSCTHCGRILVR